MAADPSPDEVLSALQVTGFLLEQEVRRIVESAGFDAAISRAYQDPDEGKSREIDVLGWKPFFIHDRFDCVFGMRLIIECKNPKSPYVVVGHAATEYEKRQMRSGASFWTSGFNVGKMPHPQISGLEVEEHRPIWDLLGLSDAPGSPTSDSFVGNQLISLERKGSEWFAGNSHIFDGIVMPLTKAVNTFKRINSNRAREAFQDHEQSHNSVTLPILVTSNKIFEVNTDANDVAAAEVPWTNVMRQVHSKNMRANIKIEVVQSKYLGDFLEQRAIAFGDEVADRIRKCPEVLMARQLTDLPQTANLEHLNLGQC
ncbi:hypothetical protein [Pseudarthrobacter sp. C4D7]|uniref:hypothetical protein n=1 Tax=Pseudarthrobacter sp. C4D7 TaxID=2735268 RepID=UPI001585A0E5|nr:hypothetical protein [Pseudarthrobacter sp. C4D7]NUT70382.1 hypothetical protein [Pseudarthrobacter sp. C4D7]